MIAFSTTDRVSFRSVNSWHKRIEAHCGQIPTLLVQNKIDLHAQAVVGREEANALAASLRLPLFLTSSKENLNIEHGAWSSTLLGVPNQDVCQTRI